LIGDRVEAQANLVRRFWKPDAEDQRGPGGGGLGRMDIGRMFLAARDRRLEAAGTALRKAVSVVAMVAYRIKSL